MRALLAVLVLCGTAWADPPAKDLIDRLASNDAAAIAAVRQRFAEGALRADDLLRIALLPLRTTSDLHERALRRLKDLGYGDVKPLVGKLLGEAVSKDADHRKVAGELLAHHCGRHARDRRIGFVGERRVTHPLLSPDRFDAVQAALESPHVHRWTKSALIDSLSELGPRGLELLPLASRVVDAMWVSYRNRKLREHAKGVLTTTHPPSPELRWGIQLAELGPAGVPGLIAALQSADPRVAEIASGALSWMNRTAVVPQLFPLTRHGLPEVRRRAFEALADVETMTPDLLVVLTQGEDDPNPDVREAAGAALTSIPGPHADVRLEAAIRTGDAVSRRDALYELAWGGHGRDLDALPLSLKRAIVGVLQTQPRYYWNSLERLVPALGALAIPATRQVCEGFASMRRVNYEAIRDMGRALGPRAVPHLVDTVLTADDERVQDMATRAFVYAFDKIPLREADRTRLGSALAARPDSRRALFIATVLAPSGDPRCEPVLADALRERSDWNRCTMAAMGLARLGPGGLAYVDRILEDLRELRTVVGKPEHGVGYGKQIRLGRALAMLLRHEVERAFELLGDPESAVSEAAAESLKVLDESVLVSRLLATYGEASRRVQAVALVNWPNPEILERGLHSRFPDVRVHAAAHVLRPDKGMVFAAGVDREARRKALAPLRDDALDVCLHDVLDPASRGNAMWLLRRASQPTSYFPHDTWTTRLTRSTVLARLRPHVDHENETVRARVRALIREIEDERR